MCLICDWLWLKTACSRFYGGFFALYQGFVAKAIVPCCICAFICSGVCVFLETRQYPRRH